MKKATFKHLVTDTVVTVYNPQVNIVATVYSNVEGKKELNCWLVLKNNPPIPIQETHEQVENILTETLTLKEKTNGKTVQRRTK